MPKLHLIEDKKMVSSFDLSEGEIVLGRDINCDIHLDSEAVSRRHVRIFTLMGDAFLEDLGSSNGTYVNGQLSKKCVLSDGDVIQIGEKELRFSQPVESTSAKQDADNMDATQIIRPGEFGPETTAVREKHRSREGISPVMYSAHGAGKTETKSKRQSKKAKTGGLWGWFRRMFS